jgi:hypothetical protein
MLENDFQNPRSGIERFFIGGMMAWILRNT